MNRSGPLEPFALGFGAAVGAGELNETWFEFAGAPVRLRVAGQELAKRIIDPFGHLRRDPCPGPALTVDVWDERATGQPYPRDACITPNGNLALHVDSGHPAVVYDLSPHSVRVLDRERPAIVGWYCDAAALPREERVKPLPHLLATWYLDRRVPIIHSAAVAHEGRGVLVAGPSGSGKSSTALACAAAGLELLGDDQVGLEESAAGEFRAHSLYSVARVESGHLRDHPFLGCGAQTAPQDGDKTLVFVATAPSVRWARVTPVHAIVLPRVARQSGLRRASGAAALHALAPSSLIGRIAGGRWTFERLSRMVVATPCFWLDIGPDPEPSANLVREALALAH